MSFCDIISRMKEGFYMSDIKIIDLHTHTDNSQDGNHSATYMAEVAATNGIETVAFTDHCEVDVFYKDGFDRRATHSFFEVSKAKSAFLWGCCQNSR